MSCIVETLPQATMTRLQQPLVIAKSDVAVQDSDSEASSDDTSPDSPLFDSDGVRPSLLHVMLDVEAFVSDAGNALVNDSFSRCFQSTDPDPWNWNAYLMLWTIISFVLRHFLFFWIKLAILIGTFLIFFAQFFGLRVLWSSYWRAKEMVGLDVSSRDEGVLKKWLSGLVHRQCQMIVFSWFGAIKYHGPRPVAKRGHIWVANHTSMIDYAVICAATPFAAIMQFHSGFIGFVQRVIMGKIDCLDFNRSSKEEALETARKMQAHVFKEKPNPLIIFPEGTCVNNDYCVMFKSGAFKIGATVCPIAIKYNKLFSDPFWNSKKEGFFSHLMGLMRAWTVAADVYFMEPQEIREGETPEEFANRVRMMIAKRANLQVVDWDGMLKYKNPSPADPNRLRYNEKVKTYTARIRAAMPPSIEWQIAEMKESALKRRMQRHSQGSESDGTSMPPSASARSSSLSWARQHEA